MRPALFALLALSTTASAVPMELTHQGRLYDAIGGPLTGSHDITFNFYDEPAAGVSLWTETQTLTFDDGYFVTQLGADTTNPIEMDDFDGSIRYLALAIDTGPELPNRQSVVSVPYAMMAGHADTADTATSAASADSVEWGAVSGVPGELSDGDDDSWALFSCSVGEVPSSTGGAWTCSAANAHTHDAAAITSGRFTTDRLPVGTGASDVAAGDHSHNAADVGAIPQTTCAVGQVLKSDGTNWVCDDDIDTDTDTDTDTQLSESQVEGFVTNGAINLAAGSELDGSALVTSVGDCATVNGACGNGMYGQPTYYFDRVSFGCPDARPIIKTFRFQRCGNLGTGSEGLRVQATCCSLQP